MHIWRLTPQCILTALGFGGMFLAGGLVSPGLATVLANVQPLLAAVLVFFVLGERLGPRRRVGLFLGFAGVLMVAAPGFGPGNANSSPLGVAYIVLGAIGVAVGNVETGGIALILAGIVWSSRQTPPIAKCV